MGPYLRGPEDHLKFSSVREQFFSISYKGEEGLRLYFHVWGSPSADSYDLAASECAAGTLRLAETKGPSSTSSVPSERDDLDL